MDTQNSLRVFYAPEYSGFIYSGLGEGDILYNTEYVNTPGLLSMLELHAGILHESESPDKRVVDYFKAMKGCDDLGILKGSFDVDGFGTARACLAWRDALVEAGWDPSAKQPSARLEALAAVERNFKGADKSLGERIADMTARIQSGCRIPEGMEIKTPCTVEYLRPMERNLLSSLEKRGVKIEKIASLEADENTNIGRIRAVISGKGVKGWKLAPIGKDDTFTILRFKDRRRALSYLTLKLAPSDRDFDLWVCPDAKALDDSFSLAGQPVSGSSSRDCLPQISQMLTIGIRLFERPVNVDSLLEWLNMSVSPIPYKTRRNLSDTIVRSGGYYNKKCKDCLDRHMLDEDAPLTQKDRDTFLPSMEIPTSLNDPNVDVERVRDFVSELGKWCRSMTSFLKDRVAAEELAKVASKAETMLSLLDTIDGKTVEYLTLEGWIRSLSGKSDIPVYKAQKGCRSVVGSPSHMGSVSPSTLMCDFVGQGSGVSAYSFLSPIERTFLGDGVWNEQKEMLHRREGDMLPFMLSRKIALVTYEYTGDQKQNTHPFIVMLQKAFEDMAEKDGVKMNIGLDPVTVEPVLPSDDGTYYHDREAVDNTLGFNAYVKIGNADLIQWPKKEFATSVGTLINHPIDYAMSTLARIEGSGLATMKDVKRTKGDVAHEVIEIMFSNGDFDIAGYGDAFRQAVLNKGQILLQSENILEMVRLEIELRRCVENLDRIIQANGLSVKGCERNVESDAGVGAIPSLGGYIDMNLSDSKGDEYVFDFKWTSSVKYYEGLLKENRSTQLAIYSQLVRLEDGKSVKAAGYFLMPDGILVSTYPFKGPNVRLVVEEGDNAGKDLFTQICNSYEYRRKEIESGKIEVWEDLPSEPSDYAKDTEDRNLVPLELMEENAVDPETGEVITTLSKKSNPFSDYSLFKI